MGQIGQTRHFCRVFEGFAVAAFFEVAYFAAILRREALDGQRLEAICPVIPPIVGKQCRPLGSCAPGILPGIAERKRANTGAAWAPALVIEVYVDLLS
jgi:hypothetical protein